MEPDDETLLAELRRVAKLVDPVPPCKRCAPGPATPSPAPPAQPAP
ncbi:hypothetical protein [Dactylosporangium sp. CA-139066]